MNKQFNHLATLGASLFIVFSPIAFGAEPITDIDILKVPPPPSLLVPESERAPHKGNSSAKEKSIIGDNTTAASIATAASTEISKSANTSTNSLPVKRKVTRSTNMERNAYDANASRVDTERVATPTPRELATTTWSFQQMPTANTMYSTPLRK